MKTVSEKEPNPYGLIESRFLVFIDPASKLQIRDMTSKLLFISIYALALYSCAPEKKTPSFVSVKGSQFIRNGKPYLFMGANYWQGMNLGSSGEGGDRQRLMRELDHMRATGITNLRILALSEGPEGSPYRVLPAVQDKPGVQKEELLQGLDFLLDEMRKRDMTAVLVLTNFWPWSGGMAQYLKWNGADSIPYPPPHPNGSWDVYQKFTASFYADPRCVAQYQASVKNIIERKNSISKISYKDDPTILSWQLCNEPRGLDRADLMNAWIDNTASFIKSIDPRHLVSTGSEGYTSDPVYAGTDFIRMHDGKDIDYATAHVWIQNWGWYDPKKHDSTYAQAREKMSAYLTRHAKEAKALGKPFVLEEFGIMKDNGNFDPQGSNLNRDLYYEAVFENMLSLAKRGEASGVNFWAWGGEGRPRLPGTMWAKGDLLTGDPPHEPQGWYSVYDSDSSTQKVIRNFSARLNQLGGN
jgi:mannan endo-1,4-beta-mannosidase